jgi:hypothetical protein
MSAADDTSLDESRDFRARVMALAKELFPSIEIRAHTSSPEVVVVGREQLGLQNLQAKYEQSGRSEAALREIIKDHFGFILSERRVDLSLAEAQTRLKPQIMPPEYAAQVTIVSLPFGRTLALGLVLDGERGYSYVRKEDVLRWEKTEQELLDLALVNLEGASRGMPMHASDNPKAKFVAVQKGDGFDAVRILLPRFQQFLATRLGSPFYFGVPNRDFLVCWNADASDQFKTFNRDKLRKDFESQPYPLSPNFFLLAADGTISEEE